MAEDQSRNLNAHAPARAACALWNKEYAAQRGGLMDFWDSLPNGRKHAARRVADQIRAAREETPAEVKTA